MPDPLALSPRVIRNHLGRAVQLGDVEAEAEFRQMLRVANIRTAIEKQLADAPPLSRAQAMYLRGVLDEHAQRPPVEPVESVAV
jgi:hypothetical protein